MRFYDDNLDKKSRYHNNLENSFFHSIHRHLFPIAYNLLTAKIYRLEDIAANLKSTILSYKALIEEGRRIDEILFSTNIARFVQNELTKRIKYRL